MPPSPMNIFLPRRRGQRTPEKHCYISTRLQRVYIPKSNNIYRHHPPEHQSHNSPYNVERHLRWWVKNYSHYRYMFCSWIYCWSGMTKYIWSTTLLPMWCRCDLDSPFLSWVFFAINMNTSNFICTKDEQRSIFVGWRCTRCRNP